MGKMPWYAHPLIFYFLVMLAVFVIAVIGFRYP